MGADRRKLQAEVEKLFRRIEEGVEEFETIMKKMNEANSENQREKFQDDLKKEIKKLQRHRDVIKGWQNGTEVKDKERLAQFRRTIEQRMEQFKEIERENKTKSYSKQGLQIQEKLDPKEQERQETIDWIQLCIEKLNTQWDKLECNMESLEGQGKKKKKVEKEAVELRAKLDRYKFHRCQLEVIMRLLNNDSLQPAQVLGIKDDLEDFISRNQEEGFIENEYIYEDLALGDLAELTHQLGNVTNIGTLEEAENPEEMIVARSPSPLPGREIEGLSKSEPPAQTTEAGDSKGNKLQTSFTRSTPTTPVKLACEKNVPRSLSVRPRTATPPPPPEIPYNSIAARGKSLPPSNALVQTTKSLAPQTAQGYSGDNKEVEMNGSLVTALAEVSSRLESGCVSWSGVSKAPGTPRYLYDRALTQEGNPQQSMLPQASPNIDPSSHVEPGTYEKRHIVLPLKTLAEQSAHTLISYSERPELEGNDAAVVCSPDASQAELEQRLKERYVPTPIGSGCPPKKKHVQEARIPRYLAVNPLGKLDDPEKNQDLQLLLAASTRMPLPMDSERRKFLQSYPNPCPESYFPSTPPPTHETVDYFSRLEPETLFFIFYYMEGTKAQLLAARALKKQSWRFHKMHWMWFQRDQEPSVITDEYEQGTYVCFDFERWVRRRKEKFTFEYKFLEDNEL